MKNNILMLLVIMLLSVSLVSSAQTQITNINTANGLQVFNPSFISTQYNTSFKLYLHVSNISNGMPVSNTEVDCYVDLYNSIGEEILNSPPFTKDANGFDLYFNILYSNFSEHGEFNAYYIRCNDSANGLGGESLGQYEITGNGRPLPEGSVIVFFSILLLTLFILTTVFIIRAIGLILESNLDILDVAYSWGIFFGLLGTNLLADIFLGSVLLSNFLDILITILAFPLIVLPVLFFFLSLFRSMKEKKEKEARW